MYVEIRFKITYLKLLKIDNALEIYFFQSPSLLPTLFTFPQKVPTKEVALLDANSLRPFCAGKVHIWTPLT